MFAQCQRAFRQIDDHGAAVARDAEITFGPCDAVPAAIGREWCADGSQHGHAGRSKAIDTAVPR